jgi:pSer/pThr/pTyr-binding forkhead associated (FHA) protein
MAKITVNRENFMVDERELEQGTLKIGRHHDNQLHIDDPAVSNHHAQIVTVFDSTYVEDLGSTNGTFVNGQKIKSHTLHNGDVLTIGHYQILFQHETIAAADEANATMMIGVTQLQELTKKAKKKNTLPKAQKRPVVHSPKPASTDNQTSTPASSKPKLTVHESDGVANDGIPNTETTELPDVDDRTPLLSETQRIPPSPHMHNRRKSDTSPLPSLKVITLAVLATIATFTLLMLFFK